MIRMRETAGFAVLLLIIVCSESLASDGRVTRIRESLEETSSLADLRAGMQELAEIGSPESAEAFANLLEQKVIPVDFPLPPFLAAMYEFPSTPEIGPRLVASLTQLWASQTDRDTIVYVAGLLARFGEPEHVGWLISEHRRSLQDFTNLSYSALVLEVLCKAKNEEASAYVIQYVLQTGDPTVKLVAEQHMRESGNSRAIDLMRAWPSVENGDFDMVIAESYLKSIIAFGDARDLDFLRWLDLNAERYFGEADTENHIRPLLTEAESAIEARSNASEPKAIWLYAAIALLILVSVGVGYVMMKRNANRTR